MLVAPDPKAWSKVRSVCVCAEGVGLSAAWLDPILLPGVRKCSFLSLTLITID